MKEIPYGFPMKGFTVCRYPAGEESCNWMRQLEKKGAFAVEFKKKDKVCNNAIIGVKTFVAQAVTGQEYRLV